TDLRPRPGCDCPRSSRTRPSDSQSRGPSSAPRRATILHNPPTRLPTGRSTPNTRTLARPVSSLPARPSTRALYAPPTCAIRTTARSPRGANHSSDSPAFWLGPGQDDQERFRRRPDRAAILRRVRPDEREPFPEYGPQLFGTGRVRAMAASFFRRMHFEEERPSRLHELAGRARVVRPRGHRQTVETSAIDEDVESPPKAAVEKVVEDPGDALAVRAPPGDAERRGRHVRRHDVESAPSREDGCGSRSGPDVEEAAPLHRLELAGEVCVELLGETRQGDERRRFVLSVPPGPADDGGQAR